jgi:hypothetical protein
MTLNRTYRPLLRFVLPLIRIDADAFISTLSSATLRISVETYESLANFVPGEMILLARSASTEDYLRERRHIIGSAITCKVDLIQRPSFAYDSLLHMLDDLFEHNSMGAGTTHVSFLDLGFVYRSGNTDCSRAAPLCRPAALALIDLWRSVSPRACTRLQDAARDGDSFERLAWDVLLTRGFSDAGVVLPCRLLGSLSTQPITYKFTEYFTSGITWSSTASAKEAIQLELRELSSACAARGGSLLYRCPQNCRDLDFLAFHSGGWVGLQTSISVLSVHGTPDLSAVERYFGIALTRYIYITVAPQLHVLLGRRLNMSRVSQVQASDWIGL